MTMMLWFWFGLAFVFFLFEVLLRVSLFLLWLGLVAGTIGISLLFIPTMAWPYQVLIFIVGSGCCVLVWYFYLKYQISKLNKHINLES